jgi:hypothetical protein
MRTGAQRTVSRQRGASGWSALLPALLVSLALASCGSGAGARGSSPTATTGSGGTTPATGAPSPAPSGPTATPFDSGTPGAVLGSSDACASTDTPSASLPATIPAYPGAQLRIGAVNGSRGVFGLCTSDSVAAVDSFYAAQLPTHGWQKVTDTSLDPSRQLLASQGATDLIITISPDSTNPGKTAVLIIYSGS